MHIARRKELPRSITVILMHGFGASAPDLASIVFMLDEQRLYDWILPTAPYPLTAPYSTAPFGGYGWFPSDPRMQERAFAGEYFSHIADIDLEELRIGADSVEELRQVLSIPYSSLVIGGFSQGAIISTEFLLRAQEPPAAALLFSASMMAKERWGAAKPHTISTPFVQTHGKSDDILPFRNAELLYALLQQKGFIGELVAFDGGHSIPSTGIEAAQRLLRRVSSGDRNIN